MANTVVRQLVLTTQASVNSRQLTESVSLFNADGTPKVVANPAAAQVDSVAADVATLKTDFNALLAKLRAAGVMLP